MECRYCQTSNSEDDHRCRRCGRRLQFTAAFVGSSAAAPALRYDAHETGEVARVRHAVPPAPAPRPTDVRKPVIQPSLFSTRELPRVIPFETFAPTAAPSTLDAPSRPAPAVRKPRTRKVVAGQQKLEFAAATRPRAEGAIYTDAQVALPTHRAMAAALDGSMVVIGLAAFGLVFHFAGGQIVFNSTTIPCFGAAAALITVFYRLLWCLANGDTAGMRWTHLLLVNFDGQTPTRAERLTRAASGLLSLMAGGLGVLWSLVDEETLTWHDHISKTFPTPY